MQVARDDEIPPEGPIMHGTERYLKQPREWFKPGGVPSPQNHPADSPDETIEKPDYEANPFFKGIPKLDVKITKSCIYFLLRIGVYFRCSLEDVYQEIFAAFAEVRHNQKYVSEKDLVKIAFGTAGKLIREEKRQRDILIKLAAGGIDILSGATFGDRVKALRLYKNLSQSELGQIIGRIPSDVSAYENKGIYPRPPAMKKLAEALDTTVSYLLAGIPEEDLINIRIEDEESAEYKQLLAYKIMVLRYKLGLTQTDVAQRLSVPQTSVSSWEKGAIPVPASMKKLADVLGATTSFLLAGMPRDKLISTNILEIENKFERNKLLGFKIKILRYEKGLSQKDLSEKLQIKAAGSYEAGYFIPSAKSFKKLAETLDTSVSILITGMTESDILKIPIGNGETKEDRKSMALKIKVLRCKAGLTEQELANIIGMNGITKQAVSLWETGEQFPKVINLVRLAGAFGITVGQLLGRDPITPPATGSPEEADSGIINIKEALDCRNITTAEAGQQIISQILAKWVYSDEPLINIQTAVDILNLAGEEEIAEILETHKRDNNQAALRNKLREALIRKGTILLPEDCTYENFTKLMEKFGSLDAILENTNFAREGLIYRHDFQIFNAVYCGDRIAVIRLTHEDVTAPKRVLAKALNAVGNKRYRFIFYLTDLIGLNFSNSERQELWRGLNDEVRAIFRGNSRGVTGAARYGRNVMSAQALKKAVAGSADFNKAVLGKTPIFVSGVPGEVAELYAEKEEQAIEDPSKRILCIKFDEFVLNTKEPGSYSARLTSQGNESIIVYGYYPFKEGRYGSGYTKVRAIGVLKTIHKACEVGHGPLIMVLASQELDISQFSPEQKSAFDCFEFFHYDGKQIIKLQNSLASPATGSPEDAHLQIAKPDEIPPEGPMKHGTPHYLKQPADRARKSSSQGEASAKDELAKDRKFYGRPDPFKIRTIPELMSVMEAVDKALSSKGVPDKIRATDGKRLYKAYRDLYVKKEGKGNTIGLFILEKIEHFLRESDPGRSTIGYMLKKSGTPREKFLKLLSAYLEVNMQDILENLNEEPSLLKKPPASSIPFAEHLFKPIKQTEFIAGPDAATSLCQAIKASGNDTRHLSEALSVARAGMNAAAYDKAIAESYRLAHMGINPACFLHYFMPETAKYFTGKDLDRVVVLYEDSALTYCKYLDMQSDPPSNLSIHKLDPGGKSYKCLADLVNKEDFIYSLELAQEFAGIISYGVSILDPLATIAVKAGRGRYRDNVEWLRGLFFKEEYPFLRNDFLHFVLDIVPGVVSNLDADKFKDNTLKILELLRKMGEKGITIYGVLQSFKENMGDIYESQEDFDVLMKLSNDLVDSGRDPGPMLQDGVKISTQKTDKKDRPGVFELLHTIAKRSNPDKRIWSKEHTHGATLDEQIFESLGNVNTSSSADFMEVLKMIIEWMDKKVRPEIIIERMNEKMKTASTTFAVDDRRFRDFFSLDAGEAMFDMAKDDLLPDKLRVEAVNSLSGQKKVNVAWFVELLKSETADVAQAAAWNLIRIGKPAMDFITGSGQKTAILLDFLKALNKGAFDTNINIMITHRCPYNCKTCIARDVMRKSPGADFPLDKLKDIFRQLDGAESVYLVGGEPFAYMKKDYSTTEPTPEFFDMLQTACRYIKRVYIDTNAFCLPENPDKLRTFLNRLPDNVSLVISIDKWHAQQASQRGINLVRIVGALERYYKVTGRLNVKYNVRLDSNDYDEMHKICEIYGLSSKFRSERSRFFVNHIIAQGGAKDMHDGTITLPLDEEDMKSHDYPHNLFMFLLLNGKLLTCDHAAFMPDPPDYTIMGDVSKQDIFSIMAKWGMKHSYGGEDFLKKLQSKVALQDKKRAAPQRAEPAKITPPATGSPEEADSGIIAVWRGLKDKEVTISEAARRIMEDILPRWIYSDEPLHNIDTTVDILQEALKTYKEGFVKEDIKGFSPQIFIEQAIESLKKHKEDDDQKELRKELEQIIYNMFAAMSFLNNYNWYAALKQSIKDLQVKIKAGQDSGKLLEDFEREVFHSNPEQKQWEHICERAYSLFNKNGREQFNPWLTIMHKHRGVGTQPPNIISAAIDANQSLKAPVKDTIDEIDYNLSITGKSFIAFGYLALHNLFDLDRGGYDKNVYDKKEQELLSEGQTIDKIAEELKALLHPESPAAAASEEYYRDINISLGEAILCWQNKILSNTDIRKRAGTATGLIVALYRIGFVEKARDLLKEHGPFIRNENRAALIESLYGLGLIGEGRRLLKDTTSVMSGKDLAGIIISLYNSGFKDDANRLFEEAVTGDGIDYPKYYEDASGSGLAHLAKAAYLIGLGKERSVAILDKALGYVDKIRCIDWRTMPLGEIAGVYIDLGYPKKALNIYRKLVKMSKMKDESGRLNDFERRRMLDEALRGFGKLGMIYKIKRLIGINSLGILGKAKNLYLKAKDMMTESPVEFDDGWDAAVEGLISSGRIDKAIKYINKVKWASDTMEYAKIFHIADALLKKDDVDRIFKEEFLARLNDGGYFSRELRKKIAMKLIDKGDIDRAKTVWEGMNKKDKKTKIETMSYAVINMVKRGDIALANAIIQDMIKLITPTPDFDWDWGFEKELLPYLAEALHAVGRFKEESDFLHKVRYGYKYTGIPLIRLGEMRDFYEAIDNVSAEDLTNDEMIKIFLAFAEKIPPERIDKDTIEDAFKYSSRGLFYHMSIAKEYFSARDKDAYAAAISARINRIMEDGFEEDSEKDVFLAFLGLGVNIGETQYRYMLSQLKKYTYDHPGYFKNLFDKKGYPAFRISEKEGVLEDTSQVDAVKVEEHINQIHTMAAGLASLDDIDDALISKAYAYCQLKSRLKEDAVLRDRIGAVRMSDVNAHLKYHCPDFNIEKARGYLSKLNNAGLLAEAIYFAAFNMHINKKEDRLLDIMLRCTVADALADGVIDNLISQSADVALQLKIIAQIYTDSKFHIPNRLGLPLHRRLAGKIEKFSEDIFREISKVIAKKITYEKERVYDFRPSKFLGIFRGVVAGDCTTSDNQGAAYTRAVHEDTMYYMFYVDGKLTGYIGLMEAESSQGKVLTVDTIQLVPPKLVPDILKKLHDIAVSKGYIGIALPSDKDKMKTEEHGGLFARHETRDALWAAFNYPEIRDAIKDLPGYKQRNKIEARPIHKKSWDALNKEHGVHESNSIETGVFFLIDPYYGEQRKPEAKPAGPAVSTEELVDVVNENDIPTGEVALKDEVHTDGKDRRHRSSGVLIVDSEGRILRQKRAASKKTGAGKYEASIGEHVSKGEDYLQAAVRGIRQEIGVEANEMALIPIAKVKSDASNDREITMIYLYFLPEGSNVAINEEIESYDYLYLGELLNDFVQSVDSYYSTVVKQLNDNTAIAERIRAIIKAISISEEPMELITLLGMSQGSDKRETFDRVAEILGSLPEDTVSREMKLNIMAHIFSNSTANPAKLAQPVFDYVDVICRQLAVELKKYQLAHPDIRELNVGIMGIGDGTQAYYSYMYAKALGVNLKITGVDISKENLAKTAILLPAAKLLCIDLFSLDPPLLKWINSFDYIEISQVLHEIYSYGGLQEKKNQAAYIDEDRGKEEVGLLLKKVGQMLCPGGQVMIMDGILSENRNHVVRIRMTKDAEDAFKYLVAHHAAIYSRGRDITKYRQADGTYELSVSDLGHLMSKLKYVIGNGISQRNEERLHDELLQAYHYATFNELTSLLEAAGISILKSSSFTSSYLDKFVRSHITIVSGINDFPKQSLRLLGVKQKIAPAENETTKYIMNELMPAELNDGRCYEIRYDRARLRENSDVNTSGQSPAEEALTTYVDLLKERVTRSDPNKIIKLTPTASGEEQGLISVTCYEDISKDMIIGQSQINIEGDLKGQPLDMIGMLNMAFAVSNIPNDLTQEELAGYDLLISYIKEQYEGLTGSKLRADNILSAIRRIVLPAAVQVPVETLEEHYRTMIERLQQFA